MSHQLIDHGDGTGEYRGWRLGKIPCPFGDGCGGLAWVGYPPYEGGAREIAKAMGYGWDDAIPWAAGRHVNGDPGLRITTIEDCIDGIEATRARLMAAALSGEDDGRVGVRIERPS